MCIQGHKGRGWLFGAFKRIMKWIGTWCETSLALFVQDLLLLIDPSNFELLSVVSRS